MTPRQIGFHVPVRRLLGIALVLAGLTPATPRAQVACGSTIGPKGQTTLTAPVGPCDGVDAAIVVDSATLDLGGQTVSCGNLDGDDTVPVGIVLIGRKAAIRNGTVDGCLIGVWLAGDGKHAVQGVSVRNTVDDGFYVEEDSSRNRLEGNSALGVLDDGFEIRSDRNTVASNTVQGAGEDGIDFLSSDGNKVVANTVSDSIDDGIEINGNRNLVKGNSTSRNGDVGLRIAGKRNRVVGNTIATNGLDVTSTEACKANRYRKNTFATGATECQR